MSKLINYNRIHQWKKSIYFILLSCFLTTNAIAAEDIQISKPSASEIENNPFKDPDVRKNTRALTAWNTEPFPEFNEPVEGNAQSISGGNPDKEADRTARKEFSRAWGTLKKQQPDSSDGAGDIVTFDGTHGVFTSYPGNLFTQTWLSSPWRPIGKLYFTTPSGSSSYCTANVVSGNSHIVTAAHCIYTRGQGFNRNFFFVPAERFGSAPYGGFSWSSAAVMTNWLTLGGRRWDVGLIRLRNNGSNRPVTFYTGWLGRAWNWGYTQNLHSVGYASNISTQYTNICTAQSFYSGIEGTDVLVKGCDMTFGSSGGGWILRYRPFSAGANNYVNGVVSGPHVGGFGNTYVGPRFSSANIVPLCNALGC